MLTPLMPRVKVAKQKNLLKKGQEELDKVVGKDNLPTFGDMSKLPYINAIYLECFR